MIMFALAVVALVLYLLRFVPSVPISSNLADFFGGMAVGLAFSATVAWFSERV